VSESDNRQQHKFNTGYSRLSHNADSIRIRLKLRNSNEQVHRAQGLCLPVPSMIIMLSSSKILRLVHVILKSESDRLSTVFDLQVHPEIHEHQQWQIVSESHNFEAKYSQSRQ
jgi:hypothetical protein